LREFHNYTFCDDTMEYILKCWKKYWFRSYQQRIWLHSAHIIL